MSQPFLWRRVNDSSGFAEPRVFIRVYLEPGSIDAAIAFYEDLQGVAHDMRFDFPEKRLTLAAVGAFLLLEGSDEALAPFRSTTGTLLVDDIEPYHRRLLAAGAQIIFGRRARPPAPASMRCCRTARWSSSSTTGRSRARPEPQLSRRAAQSSMAAPIACSPRASSAALAPRISRASLFWLSLNLPTRRVISISMPTISRSISSM
ncbi:glyoxalase [Pseudomonas aeruginosa]|nr:glyoxalase [Pseudomonas aeruginosa]